MLPLGSKHRHQSRRVGARKDLEMECLECLLEHRSLGIQHRRQLPMALLDRLTLLRTDSRNCKPQRVGLEDVANLSDLFRIYWGHRDDSVPPVVLVREKSLTDEGAKRLSCWTLARAELGGDLFLPDPLRGRQLARDDPLTKLVSDPLTSQAGTFKLHLHFP